MQKDKPTQHSQQSGQSMVEYALIVALVILSFAVAIAATGPAIGNVFSNTVYNLLGTNPDELNDLPDRDAFWLTVTWISQQTPVEEPLPTRTRIPPTEVPTDGPSPTPTDTPTETPITPTQTPTPSPTPRDFEFTAPWHDSADEDEYWRIGDEVFLGTDLGWFVKFYADMELSSYSDGLYTSEIDPDKQYNLDFNWGSGSPIDGWPSGNAGNNFSASFRRHIFIDPATTPSLELLFNLEFIDDGFRVWLLPGHVNLETTDPDDCSSTGIEWGGSFTSSGDPTVYEGTNDCLVIDGWGWHYGDVTSAKRTVAAGAYTVVVDMVEGSGGAGVKFSIGSTEFGGNPDDTPVDSGGSPTSGTADCRWGNVEDSRDSNSEDFRWDSWESGSNFGIGNRCYLELRGSVEIPTTMTDPILTFWDIWDFRDPSMQAWIEVANYDPDNDGVFDRADLTWARQDLHVGNSTNYNWTYQEINLADLVGETVAGNRYTIRFGMEVPEASYSTGRDRGYRMWWVDSINIDESTRSEFFYTAQYWDFNDVTEANDFIPSGRWELTSARTRGTEGFAWDDSAFADYQKTNLDGCGSASPNCGDYDDQNLRMHTLEFNGYIDLLHPLGVVDPEGDAGEAILSFWHAYDIDRRTGLEIQYSTDLDYDAGEAPEWKLIPDAQLNPRNSTNRPRQESMVFQEINLEQLLALEPAANGKFRIRFAMTVGDGSDTDPGWWIDDIQLERLSISNYLVYPYYEPFEQEETINDWLLGGTWGRADNRAYQADDFGPWSLTDSPYTLDSSDNPQQETFATNQNTNAQLRIALDVNNDSPDNPFSPQCELVPSNLCTDEPDNPTPIDPIMTFHWWHDFGSSGGENFYVEWKKADDSDGTWKVLWTYRDRMSYNSQSDSSTRRQWNWQRVEIDLRQIWASAGFDNSIPDSRTDDDILFRFRFTSNGNNNNADGIYIDEIRIEEREERVHALWDEGVSQDVDNPTFPTTDPLIYTTGDFRYVRFEALSEVNGNPYATIAEFNLFDKDDAVIDRSGWSIIDFSSNRTGDEIGLMLDGDTDTEWFNDTSQSHPHWFELDLGTGYQIGSFSILPRQIDPSNSWYQNGWIRNYAVYVSNDSGADKDWELIKQGQLAKTAAEQTVALQVDYTTDTAPPGSGSTVSVEGDGVAYRDNLDDNSGEIFDNWYLGGTWSVIDWEQQDGVLAFHDSTSVPLGSVDAPETAPPDFSNYTRNSGRTYNVLEMATIMDLRATPASSRPIMTLWQRHYIGSSTNIRIQVSYEDPSTIGTSGYCWNADYDQCYEHSYGWSRWETVPPWGQSGFNDWNRSGWSYQFLWKREIFDLSGYAATDDESGKRIRIRFVSDSMDRGTGDSNLRDGWYIDNIEFGFYNPPVVNIDTDTGDQFFDAARNTRNWVLEGTWGLSPEFFRGSGGGPASFGGSFWTYWIYDFNYCSNGNSGFRNCVRNEFDKAAYDDPDSTSYDYKSLALDLNFEWGSGGPGGFTYKFGGIWELTTPIIGTTMPAGNYTFVLTYDEALRMKFDTVPGGGLADRTTVDYDPYDPEWNIYNDFNTGGRQINVGNALFESGDQYKIRLEYFDRWGDAALIVSLGSSSFSFTDSPKVAAGALFPEVPAAPRSQSSMIFNGVFDLSDAVAPLLRYYTYHELGGTARVEVTTDGGFTWQQTGMRGSTPASFWTSNWSADFWDDSGRSNNEKMAYVNASESTTGNPDVDETIYPPAHSFADWYDQDINFNWGSNQSPVSGWIQDRWSAQFRRSFYLDTATDITFRITSDDGHRLWLNLYGTDYFPGCEFMSGEPLMSGRPRVSGEDDEVIGGNSSSCLLISDWENNGNNVKEVTRTIPAGNHEIILDYYEQTSGSKLQYQMWVGDFDTPSYGGVYMPDDGDWRQKVHSLASFAGTESDGSPKPPIGLRFRLDRLGENYTNDWRQADNSQSPTNWEESWWVTDISLIDTISG